MRILMLTNAMKSGGAETHILSLVRVLCRRGHRVTVASAGGEMVRELEACGATHVILPLNSRSPSSLFRAKWGLSCLLRQGFDVVHAHARLPAFLAAHLAETLGVCFVTTIHAKFCAGFFYRRFSRWGHAAIAVCEELREHARQHFSLSSADISVIPNGVDTARFCPDVTKRLGRHVLCMSRLDGDCARAPLLLCRIAPQLHEIFPDLRITIVGGGDAFSRVAEEAKRANRTSGVPIRMTGRVTEPAHLLQACDVFVGVSRSAMEAMGCGASIVLCGDEGFFGLLGVQDLPQAAQDNFCARLCSQKITEDKLFASICRALSEPEEDRRARQSAMRRYAEEHLGIERMADDTEAVYARARKSMMRGGDEVLLCGYYGFGNAGDEALLRASLTRVRERFGDVGVSVLMQNGQKRDGALFGVKIVSRKRPWEIWHAVRRARALVFGGGTLLQELTSRRSLWYYTALLRMAQKRGIACELWGNGLGPIFSRKGERRVAACLCECRYVGLRDGLSLSLARSLMGDAAERAVYEKDLASETGAADTSRVAFLWQRFGLQESGRYVLVAPKKSGRGIRDLLEQELRREVEQGKTLLFAALYPREDTRICRQMADAFGGVFLGALDAPDLVGIAARCERVYGMRLHALIFAASVETPFCAIGTDPKLSGFADEWGEWKNKKR